MSLPQLPNDGIFPVSYSAHHHMGDIMSCGRVDIAWDYWHSDWVMAELCSDKHDGKTPPGVSFI